MSVPRPKSGYNGTSKRSWRYTINALFREHLGDVSSKNLLLFPQSNIEEIKAALEVGFKPGNIYAIDKSAQVMSNLTMKLDRNGLPRVHTFGTYLSFATNRDLKNEYSQKQIPSGSIDAANLDFNGWISHDFSGEVWRFATSGVLRPISIVSITFFEGREQRETRDKLEKLGFSSHAKESFAHLGVQPITRGRLYYIQDLLGGKLVHGQCTNEVALLDTGSYLSPEGGRFRWAMFILEKLNG